MDKGTRIGVVELFLIALAILVMVNPSPTGLSTLEPTFTITKGGVAAVSLNPYFTAAATYLSTSAEGLNVEVIGDNLLLTTHEDFEGATTLTIIATDGEDAWSRYFTVVVEPGHSELDILRLNAPGNISKKVTDRIELMGYAEVQTTTQLEGFIEDLLWEEHLDPTANTDGVHLASTENNHSYLLTQQGLMRHVNEIQVMVTADEPFPRPSFSASTTQVNDVEIDSSLTNLQPGERKKVIVTLKRDTTGFSTASDKRANLRSNAKSRINQFKQRSGFGVSNINSKILQEFNSAPMLVMNLTQEEIDSLSQDPDVIGLHTNRVFHTTLVDSIPIINATHVFNLTVGNSKLNGTGFAACVIDTGLDLDHPSFAGRVGTGWDFVNNDATPEDDNSGNGFHGTHVSGIIASPNGTAPGATIIPVKVCDSAGSCTTQNILNGLDFCINNVSVYNVTVISASIGDTSQLNETDCPTTFDSLLETAKNLSLANVFAAGNEGHKGGVALPGCSQYAVSVGSTDKDDVSISSFSNRGIAMDLLAPGQAIRSSSGNGGATSLSGTSQATPHVSGVILLMQQWHKSQGFNLTVDEAVSKLNESGKKLQNWSRIDIRAAIDFTDGTGPAVAFTFNTSEGSIDLSAVPDQNNVTNTTLARRNGKVVWNRGVNVSGKNLDRFVLVERDIVSINLTGLDSSFNQSANVTISNPGCLRTSVFFLEGFPQNNKTVLSQGQLCDSNTQPSCTNVVCAEGLLNFTVSGFTGFATGENSSLTIFDQNDTLGGNLPLPVGGLVNFTANYTNGTMPINGTGVFCNITFDNDGITANMSYDEADAVYRYNRTFGSPDGLTWNVTCDGSAQGFNVLTANDTLNATGFVCGDDVSSSITLTDHLRNASGGLACIGPGLKAAANDIIIDCAGFNVTGNHSNKDIGINVTGFHNVTVRNCVLPEWSFSGLAQIVAIRVADSENTSIINNTVTNSTGTSMIVRSSRNILFTNNTVRDSLVGLRFGTLSQDSIMRGNTVQSVSGTAIAVSTSNNSRIEGNLVNISTTGVQITGSAGFESYNATVIDNVILNSINGLTVSYGENHTVAGNTIINSTTLMFFSNSPDNSLIRNNTLGAHRGPGLYIIAKNVRIENNTPVGIQIASVDGTTLVNQEITNYTITGSDLAVEESSGKLKFLSAITESGQNFSKDVVFGSNSLFVNSSGTLSAPANISFFNVGLTTPQILRNGTACPSTVCQNISFSGGTFIFNVTGFTNYSIAEADPVCGDEITSDVTLTRNLTNSTGGDVCPTTGLTIRANDVTIDCAGFKIEGNGSRFNRRAGINISFVNNTVIKNCVVKSYQNGIEGFGGTANFTVLESTFLNNTAAIYSLNNKGAVFIYNNTIINSSNPAVTISGANGSRYVGNLFSDNNDHIDISNGGGPLIKDNILFGIGAGSKSVELQTFTRNAVIINNTFNKVQFAIALSNTVNITIQGNGIENVTPTAVLSRAIYLSSTQNTTIIDNTIRSDTSAGITLASSEVGTVIINNTISNTTTGVFSVFTSNFLVVRNNTLINNTVGIRLSNGKNNDVRDNHISFSNIGIALNRSSATRTLFNATVINNTVVDSTIAMLLAVGADSALVTNNTIDGIDVDLRVSRANNSIIRGNSRMNISVLDDVHNLFVDQIITEYVLSGSLLQYGSSGVGTVSFVESVTASGDNLSSDIQLGSNVATVNSSAGLSAGANITFFGVSGSPSILRNGTACPASVCQELSNVGGTFVFNVTGFTNYSLAESPSVTCTDRINSDVTLSGNVLNSTGGDVCPGDGLFVNASGVTIDCNGFNITGSGGSGKGINITLPHNHTTVKNCNIRNFQQGIFIRGGSFSGQFSNNHTVIDNYFFNNTLDGIIATQGSNINISNNTFEKGSDGIEMSVTPNASITNNTATTSGTGIKISFSSSTGAYVYNNEVHDTFSNGIAMGGTNGIMENNRIINYTQGGFSVGTGVRAVNNTFAQNPKPPTTTQTLVITSQTGIVVANNSPMSIRLQLDLEALFIDQVITNYTFSDTRGVTFRNSSIGEITWFENLSGSTRGGNFSDSVLIFSNNTLFVNTSKHANMSAGANISFFNVGLSDPEILRNGTACPSNVCQNISFSGSTFTFNVTGFTNYSIGEAPPPPSCNKTITSSVAFTDHLRNSTGGLACPNDGLVVTANDLTIDCAGFSLTGNATPQGGEVAAGINLSSVDRVTIKNCVIQNFGNGIHISNSSHNLILNNTIQSNSFDAVHIDIGHNNTIRNNSLLTISDDGIDIDVGQNTTVIGNTLTHSGGYGVYTFNNASDTKVINNYMVNCSSGVADFANNTVVINNTFINSTEEGYFGQDGFNSTIINNSFIGTLESGVEINRVPHTTIANNTFTGNGDWDIAVFKSHNVYVSDNVFQDGVTAKVRLNRNHNSTFIDNSEVNLTSFRSNNSLFTNSTINDYVFTESIFAIGDNVGELRYLADITADGTNLSTDIAFSANSLSVDSSSVSGLSAPANISFFGVSLSEPVIKLNGSDCPESVCKTINFSGSTFLFNVTGFTTYSIEGNSSNATPTPPPTTVPGGGGSGGGGRGAAEGPETPSAPAAPAAAAPAGPASVGAPSIELPLQIPMLEEELFVEVPIVCAFLVEGVEIGLAANTVDTSRLTIPSDYKATSDAFNFECEGQSIDLTVSVPDTYKDLRMLRCEDGQCTTLRGLDINYNEALCGGTTATNLKETEMLAQQQLLEAKEFAKYGYEREITTEDPSITFGQYTVAFTGVTDPFIATIESPRTNIAGPQNPSARIVGSPLVLTAVDYAARGALITMPYVAPENIDVASLGIYVYHNNIWESLPTERGDGYLTANLKDLNGYMDESTLFAVIGIECDDCAEIKLQKVHDLGSRDAVFLIHGYMSRAATWDFMVEDFKMNKQPFQLWTIEYPSSKSLDEITIKVMEHLEANHGEYDSIQFVGHSLGGFVAQDVVYKAQQENLNFLSKVSNVILVGSPNEGSPGAGKYGELWSILMNTKRLEVFNPASPLAKDLAEGTTTPRVEGINYFVIAGTQPIVVDLPTGQLNSAELLGLEGKNDGIATVKSVSRVGNDYINNECVDYFEVHDSHTELINKPVGRKAISRVLTKELYEQGKQASGYTQYFRFKIDECNSNENYVVIGKEINKDEAAGLLQCTCGNGVCGVDETLQNCPIDCQPAFVKAMPWWMHIGWLVLFGALLLIVSRLVKNYKEGGIKNLAYTPPQRPWQYTPTLPKSKPINTHEPPRPGSLGALLEKPKAEAVSKAVEEWRKKVKDFAMRNKSTNM